MKIPDRFAHLSNSALVLAAGKFEACIYVLQNGRVVEDEDIRKERLTYSDREGFFGRTEQHGQSLGAGTANEDTQEDKVHKEFLNDLANHVSELAGNYAIEKVLLFAPAENLPEVRNSLSSDLRTRIFLEAPGNFVKQPVLKLFERAQEILASQSGGSKEAIAKPEAQKLLKRPGMGKKK